MLGDIAGDAANKGLSGGYYSKAVPKEYWIRINQQMITFGRNVCRSRSPKCEICQFHKYCTEYKNRTGDGPDTRKKPSGKE